MLIINILIMFVTIYIVYKTYKHLNMKGKNIHILFFIISIVNLIVFPIYLYKEYSGGYEKVNYNTNLYKPLNHHYIINNYLKR
jgi:hypothetical protein